MSSAVVFVFLLDNAPGFYVALNETLHSTYPNTSSHLDTCNDNIAKNILNTVSKTDLHSKPALTYPKKSPREEISETLYDLGTVFQESLELQHSEDPNNTRNYPISTRNYESNDSKAINLKKAEKIGTTVGFPKSAQFLVAIFETLSNVTAQTCAGTLVARRWVLTAASCLNLLGNLYSTGTEKSRYTIIAGSANPLSGGTGHNVTKVVLHPMAQSGPMGHGKGPYLALMRIEPEVTTGVINLVDEDVDANEVMVYGWILAKNESGADTMKPTSVAASVLYPDKCSGLDGYNKDNVLCLLNKDINTNITLLSSGGPVLVMEDNEARMVAVAQTDDHVFLAFPVENHLKWMQSVLSYK